MAWKLNSDRPLYAQIVERLQMQIISGFYAPGDKLPSVRDLAAEAGVNPNTMQKALTELERGSLVVTQRTSGRTVTEETTMIKITQKELASRQIKEFLERMKELGFEMNDIISLIEEESAKEESLKKESQEAKI
jgi:DNA-binding transcriptional regulator YhcF (GntR family)